MGATAASQVRTISRTWDKGVLTDMPHLGVNRLMPHPVVWRLRFARWILKAINTHSEYVILIAFQWQQWLSEGASVFVYTCIVCLET